MAHVRQQLREAIALALTGLATTGANVFESRTYTLLDDELPGLLVYAQSEDALPGTLHVNPVIDRSIDIVVQGVAKATADLDDTLDQIALEVETALAFGVAIGPLTIALTYAGCDIEFDSAAEKPVGSISMRFTAQIFSQAGSPDTFS